MKDAFLNTLMAAYRAADQEHCFIKLLQSDVAYPTIFVKAEVEDQDNSLASELLNQAFQKPESNVVKVGEREYRIIGCQRNRLGRTAVVRVLKTTTQISDMTLLDQSTSIIGRCGSLKALARIASKCLINSIGIQRPLSVNSMSELGFALWNRHGDPKATMKLMSRMNKGESISEGIIPAISEALGLDPNALYFDPPCIYTESAFEKRMEKQEDEERLRRSRLKNTKITVTKLELWDTAEFVALEKCYPDQIIFETVPTDSGDTYSEPQCHAINNFYMSLRAEKVGDTHARALRQALFNLKELGLEAWYGSYTDREPNNDPDRFEYAGYIERAKTVPKTVVAISRRTDGRPSITRDLSHFDELGETYEDIARDLELP